MTQIILTIVLIWPAFDCANILVYSPTIGFSHVEFLGRISEVAIKNGHNVVLLMPIYDASVTSNGTNLALSVIRYHPASYDASKWQNLDIKGHNNVQLRNRNQISAIDLMQMAGIFDFVCKAMVNDDSLIRNLQNYNFSLAMGELYDGCFIGLAYAIGIGRVISASATTVAPRSWSRSEVVSLSYVPNVYLPYTDMMTFFERCYNFLYSTVFHIGDCLQRIRRQKIFNQKFGKNFPALHVLEKRMVMASLVNGDDFLHYPAPVEQGVVHVGAVQPRKETGISKLMNNILDSSDSGVVLVSFGTIFKFPNLDITLRNAVFDTFSGFCDYTFLVKYDGIDCHDVIAVQNHSNVFATGWLPQKEMLRHPKVKAILTHGGANSVLEAANSGKPMIIIPLFGDQARNAGSASQRGIAYTIHRHELDSASLRNALQAILGDNVAVKSDYARKANHIGKMLQDRGDFTLGTVQKWIERVLKLR